MKKGHEPSQAELKILQLGSDTSLVNLSINEVIAFVEFKIKKRTIFFFKELLEDMVPEDDSTKGDPNENITDGHGNLATGWC